MAAIQPKKMNWWYQSIIEWMIENPDQPLRVCAQEMGVTQSWLSCIIHSDAFKLAYSQARGEHFENTSYSVISKMEGIAIQAAGLISERLELEGDDIPLGQLNSTAELALKALGFTSSHGRPSSVNVNLSNQNGTVGVSIAVEREVLQESRARMRQLAINPPSPPVGELGADRALELSAEGDDPQTNQLVEVPAAKRL